MAKKGFLFWTLGSKREVVAEVVGGQVIDCLRSLRKLGCLPPDENAKIIGELLNRRALTGAGLRIRWLEDQLILQIRKKPLTPDEILALVDDQAASERVFQGLTEITVSI